MEDKRQYLQEMRLRMAGAGKGAANGGGGGAQQNGKRR
jgi:hypothetical protein